DPGALAARERDGELREGRAAAARAHRPDRLRSGHDAALRRPLGHAARADPRRADRPPRGAGAPAPSCALGCACGAGAAAAAQVSTAAIGAVRARRRAVSPWLVAVAVVIPTFMEVLDTTIANVALRYIAGGLSSPATDSEWVITSYLAANAIIL